MAVGISSRRPIITGSILIAVVVVLIGACFGGSYVLALAALHNHNDLSIQQSCIHWGWIYRATASGEPSLHAAVGRTLAQLRCGR